MSPVTSHEIGGVLGFIVACAIIGLIALIPTEWR